MRNGLILRSAGALALAMTLLAACTQGLATQEGEPGARSITDVKFLFTEGETEFTVESRPESPVAEVAPAVAAAATDLTPRPQQRERLPVPDLTAAPVQAATVAAAPPPSQAAAAPSATAAEVSSALIDTQAIVANPQAASIALPHSAVDPQLELFGESPDPEGVLPPELIAQAKLQSFFITGSQRQPDLAISGDSARPMRFIQRIFVHEDLGAATDFYVLLRDEAAPTIANGALDFFRDFYPDLEPSARTTEEFRIAADNHLVELLIDPRTTEDPRALGPEDPSVYYLVLREGRVTALLELFFLAPQNPLDIVTVGELLIQRIPAELRSATAP